MPDPSAPILTAGVLADTHVPDRARELHPAILPLFTAAGVRHIFHAGDVCSPRVLAELGTLAPVTAVRGNRDFALMRLPMTGSMELAGVRIGLTHGHGGLLRYLWDKVQYYRRGYSLNRYLDLLIRAVPGARVMIFGHTHFHETLWYRNILLFNPGSAVYGQDRHSPPTVGLLKIFAGQRIEAEILPLEGFELKKRRWMPVRAE